MSMSSYLISHNHPLYILLTGTGKIMDIKQTVGKTFLKPNYQENVDRLMPFWKEQEGNIKYQTNIKQETTTPVMGGKISSQNPYIKTPSFDEKTQTFKAYYDKIGKKWTIGYGHTDGVEPEDTATINQADAFLEEDGKRLIHETDNLLKEKYQISIFDLPESGQDLVGDMGFNIGPDKFTTEWPNMLKALKNKDWGTVSNEYTAINTPERNKARFEKWIEPHLIAEQSFKSKQFEQQDKKESLKKQKIVYDTIPDLVNAIQTQEIPKEKIKGFVTDAASGKLLSEIGERIHVPEFIENLGIDVDVKGKDEFAIKGKGITYKQKPGEKSVSGKGYTYTQTDEQKRLEKKFGKEGGITGSVGISKSDFGDEKTIGGQINIPTDKIKEFIKRGMRTDIEYKGQNPLIGLPTVLSFLSKHGGKKAIQKYGPELVKQARHLKNNPPKYFKFPDGKKGPIIEEFEGPLRQTTFNKFAKMFMKLNPKHMVTDGGWGKVRIHKRYGKKENIEEPFTDMRELYEHWKKGLIGK